MRDTDEKDDEKNKRNERIPTKEGMKYK